jgi:hypothetical protein
MQFKIHVRSHIPFVANVYILVFILILNSRQFTTGSLKLEDMLPSSC